MKKSTAALISRWIPARPKHAHKGDFGRVVIIAGSPSYRGAGILAACGALRTGCGYVHVAAAAGVYPPILQLPEAIYLPLNKLDLPRLKDAVFVIGPGLALGEARVRSLLMKLKRSGVENVLVDAEALNVLAKKPMKLPATWLLTPHEGEMGRLLGIPRAKVHAHREQALKTAVKKFGARILLKGPGTLIAGSDGEIVRISTGNNALAKGGTGDVLAGFIAGVASQKQDLFKAAVVAAHLHGAIADRWVREKRDGASLTPSDLLERAPQELRRLRGPH